MELIFLGLCLVILLFNLFVSFTRGTRKTILRLITVVIAAVGAFFLARALAGAFGREIALWLEATVGADTNFAPLFSGEVAANDAIAVLVEMLIAPLMFLLLYVVLKAVLLLIYWILCGVTRPEFEEGVKSHFIALPIGLVIALVGIMVFVTPVFGYLDIVSSSIAKADNENAVEAVKQAATYNTELIEPARNTPVLSGVYNTVGVKIFDGLSKGDWQGQEVTLRAETDTLADIVANAQVLAAKPVEQYGDAECAAVDALAADVSASPMLSVLCSGVLNTASNHWLAGESFLGIAPPDIGVNGSILLNAFLTVFATSTQENIGVDLDFFADVFALAVEYQLISGMSGVDEEAFAALITDTGFLRDVQTLLDTHPRMKPVGVALADVGMRSVLKAMGLPENVLESHGALMGDLAAALQSVPITAESAIDMDALTDSFAGAFDDHAIAVSDAAAQLVATGVADHFTTEQLQTLTTEDIMAKLAERFHTTDLSVLTNAEEVPAE